MIKIRMTGERNAIHDLAAHVRSSFPDQPITIQDASDRLGAKIDLSLPVGDALSLFGGLSATGNSGCQTIGRLPGRSASVQQSDGPPFAINWRSALHPDRDHVS